MSYSVISLYLLDSELTRRFEHIQRLAGSIR
jgi:hypothetical protein